MIANPVLRLRASGLATRAPARCETIRMRLKIGARDAERNAAITRRIVAVRR